MERIKFYVLTQNITLPLQCFQILIQMFLFLNIIYAESMIYSQDSSDQNSHFFLLDTLPLNILLLLFCVCFLVFWLAGWSLVIY